jgi:hypothetical protein
MHDIATVYWWLHIINWLLVLSKKDGIVNLDPKLFLGHLLKLLLQLVLPSSLCWREVRTDLVEPECDVDKA